MRAIGARQFLPTGDEGSLVEFEAEMPAMGPLDLLVKVRSEIPTDEPICKGTNLAIRQYLTDVRERGFEDARLQPHGPLTAEEIDRLPAA